MEADGNLKQEELDFFLKGNIALEKSARQKPFPWIPDQGWEDIIRLCTVTPDVFGSLADDIERNESAWKEVSWYLELFVWCWSLLLLVVVLPLRCCPLHHHFLSTSSHQWFCLFQPSTYSISEKCCSICPKINLILQIALPRSSRKPIYCIFQIKFFLIFDMTLIFYSVCFSGMTRMHQKLTPSPSNTKKVCQISNASYFCDASVWIAFTSPLLTL